MIFMTAILRSNQIIPNQIPIENSHAYLTHTRDENDHRNQDIE